MFAKLLGSLLFMSTFAYAAEVSVHDEISIPVATKMLPIAEEETYAEVEAYCLDDTPPYMIPNLALLKKVIVIGDVQHLDRWFWSSTEVPAEECSAEKCYYQVYAPTLESKSADATTKSGHALCVNY